MTLGQLIEQLMKTELTFQDDTNQSSDRDVGVVQDALASASIRQFRKVSDTYDWTNKDSFTSSGHYLNVSDGSDDVRYEMLREDLPDALPEYIYAYSITISKVEYLLFAIEGKPYLGVGYKE